MLISVHQEIRNKGESIICPQQTICLLGDLVYIEFILYNSHFPVKSFSLTVLQRRQSVCPPKTPNKITYVRKTTGERYIGDRKICGFQQMLRVGQAQVTDILGHSQVKLFFKET